MTLICGIQRCDLWVTSISGSAPRRWKVYSGDSPYAEVEAERAEDALAKAHRNDELLKETDSGS